MPPADDLWAWINPPLEELKEGYTAEPGTPWEDRRESFLRALGLSDPSHHPVIYQLLEQLDKMSEDERTNLFRTDQVDTMARELIQEHTADQKQEEEEEEAGGESSYDEQAWAAYLQENGPQWDGTEESWDQFSQWFAYYAAERGLRTPATALLGYLSAQSAPQRITTLAQYGITITPAAEPASQQTEATGQQSAQEEAAPYAGQADESSYDEQAWAAYLQENGPQWDGTEESWDQFSQWFAYYAAERGLRTPATALLGYLSAQSAPQRITTLAQYGITISPPAEPASQEAGVTGQVPQAQAQAQEPGQATEEEEGEEEEDTELSPEDMDGIMDELLAENEEFKDIPEARRREMMAEVLSEMQSGTA